jgi:hypothetical protein
MPYVQFPEGTTVSAQVQGLIDDGRNQEAQQWKPRVRQLKRRLRRQEQITIEWQKHSFDQEEYIEFLESLL